MKPEWNRCPNCGERLSTPSREKFKYRQEGNKGFLTCPRGHENEAGDKEGLSYRQPYIEGSPGQSDSSD